MEIFIDTNIINKNYLLKGEVEKLTDLAQKKGHRVFLPKVVFEEMQKHFQDDIQSSGDSVMGQLQRLIAWTGDPLACPISKAWIVAKKREYAKALLLRLNKLGIKVSPKPAADLTNRYVSRRKPFKAGGAGLADALIWESILECGKKHEDCFYYIHPRILLISNNHTDFCNSNKFDLDNQLVEDLIFANVSENLVQVVPDIASALKLIVETDNELLTKEMQAMIKRETISHSDVVDNIEEKLTKFTENGYFEPDQVGLHACFESVSIEGCYEDFTYDRIVAEYTKHGDIQIQLDAATECIFDFFIQKSDYMCSEDGFKACVYDHEWNDHYVAAQKEKETWFSANITLDRAATILSEIDIDINQEKNLEGLLETCP
jgi:hypothetical protein